MRILITGIIDALEYTPTDPTYAIRIKNSKTMTGDFEDRPLKESPFFEHVHTYIFDDVYPEFGWEKQFTTQQFSRERDTLFDDNLAKEIINDFIRGRGNCKTLLIHCSRGLNRSPSIAMALNDIFNLGENTEKLKLKYPNYRKWMYDLMIKASGVGIQTELKFSYTYPGRA